MCVKRNGWWWGVEGMDGWGCVGWTVGEYEACIYIDAEVPTLTSPHTPHQTSPADPRLQHDARDIRRIVGSPRHPQHRLRSFGRHGGRLDRRRYVQTTAFKKSLEPDPIHHTDQPNKTKPNHRQQTSPASSIASLWCWAAAFPPSPCRSSQPRSWVCPKCFSAWGEGRWGRRKR
jgi:hypothetical protein